MGFLVRREEEGRMEDGSMVVDISFGGFAGKVYFHFPAEIFL
jgi:hypothetical protein